MGAQTRAEALLPDSPTVQPLCGGIYRPPRCCSSPGRGQGWAFCLHHALVNMGLTLLMLINLKGSARRGPRGRKSRVLRRARLPAAAPAWCHPAAGATARAGRASPALQPTASVLAGRPSSGGCWRVPGVPCPAGPAALGRRSPSPFARVQSDASASSSRPPPVPCAVRGPGCCHRTQPPRSLGTRRPQSSGLRLSGVRPRRPPSDAARGPRGPDPMATSCRAALPVREPGSGRSRGTGAGARVLCRPPPRQPRHELIPRQCRKSNISRRSRSRTLSSSQPRRGHGPDAAPQQRAPARRGVGGHHPYPRSLEIPKPSPAELGSGGRRLGRPPRRCAVPAPVINVSVNEDGSQPAPRDLLLITAPTPARSLILLQLL